MPPIASKGVPPFNLPKHNPLRIHPEAGRCFLLGAAGNRSLASLKPTLCSENLKALKETPGGPPSAAGPGAPVGEMQISHYTLMKSIS